jgi:glycosyltransferase involved in cell wall biosynthesis
MPESRFRVAIVASHPVQYQAPWYRALAERVDLHVFFAHRPTAGDQARAGFGVGFDWDVPLLNGYRFDWLANVASSPGLDRFSGCDTPDIDAMLGRGRFDAVIVNGWQLKTYWQAVRAARRRGIPVMVRGDSQLETARSAVRRATKRVVYPRLLRAFDAFLAVGCRSAEYYKHYGVAADRIYGSPHCVDNRWFEAASGLSRSRTAAIRRDLGMPADAIVFAFAAKLIEKKRPQDFVAALTSAGLEHPRVWGLIVGDGPLRADVDAQVAQSKARIRTAGFRNQRAMPAMYAAADAFVLASDGAETWGLVVNEAMACGVPAIVSDAAGCHPDLIIEGRTGFGYRCGDVSALAALMSRAAADPARLRAMGVAARAHIRAYSPEAAADGVLAALNGAHGRLPAPVSEPARPRGEHDLFNAVS